jgi:hypothetical protein
MKKITIIMSALTLVVVASLVACNSSTSSSKNNEGLNEGSASNNVAVKGIDEAVSKEAAIKKGKYLVTIMGCNDCHSPKVMTPHGPDTDTALIQTQRICYRVIHQHCQ